MKHYKSYSPQSSYSKTITISKNYRERYCCYKQASSGGSFVVDFILTVKQNKLDYVNLYYVEDDNTKMTIESISLGIQRFIDYLDKQEVALRGIDIIIENAIVHPVDFNPRRYEIETMKLLSRIFFTHGKHILTNKFNSKIEFIEFPQKSIWDLFDGLQVRNSFPLPNTLHKLLQLPEKTYLQKEFTYNDFKESVKLELATDIYSERHVNGIYLYSENTPVSIQLFLIVEEVIKKLIKDVYDNDFNLASLHIGIREINLESSYFLSYGTFRDELYWYLKNIILTYNEIKQI